MNATNERKKTRLKRVDRRGTAVVEFAVLSPLLFLLVMGAIDVGQYVNVSQTVSDASREGARLAAQNEMTSSTSVENVVLEYLEDSFPNVSDAALSAACSVTVTDSASASVTDLTTISEGSSVSVQVDLDFDTVRWIQSVSLGGNRTLSTTTITRRE
jgi:Flp pilus assembly protein TadG